MKIIRLKHEVARVPTRIYVDFSEIQGRITVVNDGIWQKFELIPAFMHVLTTCKYEEDSIKKEGPTVATTYLPLQVYGYFSRHSEAANSAIRSRIWLRFESCLDLWLSSFLQEQRRKGNRVVTRFSLWELSVGMERVLIWFGPKSYVAFPPHTHGWMPAWWVYYKQPLWGDLKMGRLQGISKKHFSKVFSDYHNSLLLITNT